jgi:hypothetical protein
MTTESTKFYKLIDSFEYTLAMSTEADLEYSIAEYYELEKYMEFFKNYTIRFSDNDIDETEKDILELTAMHNDMMDEIKIINPDEAAHIEEALSNL